MKIIYRMFGYFIYVLLLGYLLIVASYYSRVLFQTAKQTFNTIPHLVFTSVYPILFGLLLSLPSMITKVRSIHVRYLMGENL